MAEYPQILTSTLREIAEKDVIFPPPALYFDKNSVRLAEMFSSNTTDGLKESQIENIRANYGVNLLPEPKKESVLHMIYKQLTDFMIMILIVVAIVEGSLGSWSTSIILGVVVLFNVVVGVTQEYKSNQALEALLTLSVPKATVIRGGNQSIISSSELVPGDLVVLDEGDAVPADLRLCEVSQLEIIESILTGESLGIVKSIRTIKARTRKIPLGDCKGNAFMTTIVTRGRGKGIVVRTGLSTEIGRISAAITNVPDVPSSIQKKLDSLGKILVVTCLTLVIIIIAIAIGWIASKGAVSGKDWRHVLEVGISLGVSVIPEGLVAVVTVVQALGVSRMAAKNAIVRKAAAVEAVGSVTFICSDKTGTLTEGKMGSQSIFTSDDVHYNITHSTSLDPNIGEIQIVSSLPLESSMCGITPTVSEPISVKKTINDIPGGLVVSMMVCSLCSNSTISKDPDTGQWVPIGDPTEVALTVVGMKSGLPKEYFQEIGLKKLGEYAFDSDRKLMSTIYSGISLPNKSCFVLCKGAPEAVIKSCKSYLASSKAIAKDYNTLNFIEECPELPLDDVFLEYISKKSVEMASKGLRVLALAIKRVTLDVAEQITRSNDQNSAESDLLLVGLIGLIDPPKPGVKESVRTCKDMGIQVVMITGDHIDTARAIAKDLGIIDDKNGRSMKGYEIDLLSEEILSEQKPFPVVFARVSPDNKLKIVKALQRKGNSVVMTGDGVNDAPAIKQADVGISMGISGTEITKQAASIILADDNFSTIVEAVREGRCVYDNIIKFLVYLLSCNASEVFLFLIAVTINVELPFTANQLLWANIFADIPPAMSIGVEQHEKDILIRPPKNTNAPVMSKENVLAILVQSLIITSVAFVVYMLALKLNIAGAETLRQQQSLTFSVLVGMHLSQAYFSRTVLGSIFHHGVTENHYLIYATLLSTFFLVLGVELPGLNTWLDLESIRWVGWGVVILCLLIHGVMIETGKYFLRRYLIKSKGGVDGTFVVVAVGNKQSTA